MLLMFVTAQTHFSALAQPAPGGQHPALLASYVKRPPWKVAGVDHAVGVPPTATLTDWKLYQVLMIMTGRPSLWSRWT
jgi:hypothetical protein